SCSKRKSAAAPFKATHRKVMTDHNVAVMICGITDNAEPAVHAPPAGSFLQSLRHAQLPAHRRSARHLASIGKQPDESARSATRRRAVCTPSWAATGAHRGRHGLL